MENIRSSQYWLEFHEYRTNFQMFLRVFTELQQQNLYEKSNINI